MNTPVALIEVAPARQDIPSDSCRLKARESPEKVKSANIGSEYGEERTAGVGGREYKSAVMTANDCPASCSVNLIR